jgi:hypothetical protein
LGNPSERRVISAKSSRVEERGFAGLLVINCDAGHTRHELSVLTVDRERVFSITVEKRCLSTGGLQRLSGNGFRNLTMPSVPTSQPAFCSKIVCLGTGLEDDA